MTKKFKNEIKKLPKRFMAFTMIFAMLFSYFAPITNVFAESIGTGESFITFNLDANGILNVTVQSAIDEVDQTGKVTLLKDRNINQTDGTAIFAADKTIELELNNKTLTVTEINSFVNHGTLTINGIGTIRGENIEEGNINYIISNSGGNLTLNSNVLATSSRGVIFSSGNLDIDGLKDLCDKYDIPIDLILQEFETEITETSNKHHKNIINELRMLKKSLEDILILYLPTYRRIEQDLKVVLGDKIDDDSIRRRNTYQNNEDKNFAELVEFGMGDVDKIIKNTLSNLRRFFGESLNSLSLSFTFVAFSDVPTSNSPCSNFPQISTLCAIALKHNIKLHIKQIKLIF